MQIGNNVRFRLLMKIPFYRFILLPLMPLLLVVSSCESDIRDSKINFTGDSIVARWDIRQSFPSRNVQNHGVGGSGIKLIESQSGTFVTEDVVVLSGTNDNNKFSSRYREDYARRFVDAVAHLTTGRIFVISVLPRAFNGDRKDINKDISEYNDLLEELFKQYPKVHFIDVYDLFMSGSTIESGFYSDGLHLNEVGYEILTENLRNAL